LRLASKSPFFLLSVIDPLLGPGPGLRTVNQAADKPFPANACERPDLRERAA
jgi:hypothetical protein